MSEQQFPEAAGAIVQTPPIDVIIATKGRADRLNALLECLSSQSLLPDRVWLVGTNEADFEITTRQYQFPVHRIVSPSAGTCAQRNLGVLLACECANGGYIVFFDDDFRPAYRWLENMIEAFSDPGIIGLTGQVIADGAKGLEISETQARREIENSETSGRNTLSASFSLYGCNMAFRRKFLTSHKFDENLPLYAWMEDFLLARTATREGRLVRASGCRGVHLGVKSGRVSGQRFGYSQIANPHYIASVGAMSRGAAFKQTLRALSSNTLRSCRLHPIIDYRGRLRGNVRALTDSLTGRMHPQRILEFDN